MVWNNKHYFKNVDGPLADKLFYVKCPNKCLQKFLERNRYSPCTKGGNGKYKAQHYLINVSLVRISRYICHKYARQLSQKASLKG
ncbi:hypothetical protein XELAEV_18038471mg [Xenopus laevis]|uniref:Uncharacterized protein n=1 Tax=Xenopus laevis TaxID=8355 RepID=A0A974H6Y0_XENLA|nr:hypothetical protein XELAEV_18038471mg [Xenopus laevis]